MDSPRYEVIEQGYENFLPQYQRYIPEALSSLYPRPYAIIAPVYPDHDIVCACGYRYTLTDKQYNAAPYPDTCWKCNTARARKEAYTRELLKSLGFPGFEKRGLQA